MTGAGRSTAAKELEDLGYFVVDNLPPELVDDVVRLVDERQGRDQPVAVVVDVRTGSFFGSLQEHLARRHPVAAVRRCCSSRPPTTSWCAGRRPPAAASAAGHRPAARRASHREREVLASLRGDADLVIDTTSLNVHQLKRPGRPGASARRSTWACRSTWSASASSTASRSTPTCSPTCASCPTRTGCPSCATRPDATRAVGDYVKGRADAQHFLDRYVPVIETAERRLPRARASGS